jgi:hypothetical protein
VKTVLMLLLTAALTACGGGGDGDDAATGTATDAGEATQQAAGALCEPQGNRMAVDASCFEEDWPLTVDSGELVCEEESVVLDTGDALYAVNAEAELRGVQPIDVITADEGDDGATDAEIDPLIRAGLQLCEG